MPKIARELSALEVGRLARPGWHAVGRVAGLLLRIDRNTGARYWVLRTTVSGKRRDIGIGPYPEVTLAKARETAAGMRMQARQGTDPIAERQAVKAALMAEKAKIITFGQAARRFIKSKAREFRNAKHAAQWSSTLDTYAGPVIGHLQVDRVELAHVVQILEPIWTTKTETATRVRGRIESVLDWATVSGFRSGDNPARWKGNLEAIFPKPGKLKRVQHHRAVPVAEAPAFMTELRKREGMAALALEFAILTAARSGEVRGATWAEVDMEARTWTVSAQRMKAGKAHVVPLTDDALELLKHVPRFEGSDHVFPSARGGALSDVSLSAVMRRMGVDATPHGFRSTFRDWCAEHTNYPRDVAEMALAHQIPSAVERAYRRGDLLEKRRRLMADWAKFLRMPLATSEVVPIRMTMEG